VQCLLAIHFGVSSSTEPLYSTQNVLHLTENNAFVNAGHHVLFSHQLFRIYLTVHALLCRKETANSNLSVKSYQNVQYVCALSLSWSAVQCSVCTLQCVHCELNLLTLQPHTRRLQFLTSRQILPGEAVLSAAFIVYSTVGAQFKPESATAAHCAENH